MWAVTKVTTAIVPASGTSRRSAASPTTTPLKAATIVTPRKYPRSEVITEPLIVRATGSGSPTCRSTARRIPGPSLSRKNVPSAANDSPKRTDASPRMPWTIPCTSVEIACEVACFAVEVEPDERRRERTWHVPLEQSDERHRDDRDDERANHRPDDRVRGGEEPDQAYD